MSSSEHLAREIRKNVLRMVHQAKASHVASALSVVDILAVLYGEVMRLDNKNPKTESRDRFILSKGHACAAVYATLAEVGFIHKEELNTYGADFSWLMNHISHKVNGVEFSTGSLGHGLPFGVGKALAAKARQASWRTYVLLSDGEMDEGSNWEALMFAAHHRLANLTAIVDYNKLQSLDSVANTLGLEPLEEKLRAFGWDVHETDGHNHYSLSQAMSPSAAGKPTAVIAHTIKGRGVSFMENSVAWHYKNPDDEQLAQALRELEGSDA
jgi:transketolase